MRALTFTVPPELANRTVDTLLRRELHLSGIQVRRAKILPDGITLDGIPVFVSARAEGGQTLSVRLDAGGPVSQIVPVEGPVDIAYGDDDLLVIRKAPGLSVHPGPGHYDDTLGNFLAWKYRNQPNYVFRPVHRLDRGTSGLMVVALHAYAQERLKGQLHTESFRRVYLAVCEGAPVPPSGVIDVPIGRAEGSILKREVRPDGALARTGYEVLGAWDQRALVRLVLETGRTHQIRVHMAHLGHPLTGDFLYGVEDHDLISRPALHSSALSLLHPVTGLALHFTAPLPQDIASLVGMDIPPEM